ncbi:MAG: hypothetical protein JNN13_13605 [Planctomycetes bacterium]|nr:hypothetical protein [Planctomycetota bacterium]
MVANGSPAPLLLIANPISGGGKGRRLAPQLAAALAQRGVPAEVFFTTRAGDATARARAAGEEPWGGLVALGGDGTVNEVLNGMPDPSRPLGVLPVGTANVLAVELGLPRRVEAAADVLARGSHRELAIGTVRSGGGPDRRFLLFASAGIDGDICERLQQVRTGTLGKHKWFAPILRTLRRWPQFSLRATLADGSVLDDLQTVLVSRVRNFGGWLHLTPEVDAGSGLLHVLGFRSRSRLGWLWHGARGLCGGLVAGKGLVTRTTTALRIDGRAPVQVDGDFAGHSPLELGLAPVKARIFAPAG